jgi:signal peptidase II
MTHNRLSLLGVLTGLVVLAADQASKYWVLHGIDLPQIGQIVLLPMLNLTFVQNSGVTFGLLNGYGAWSYLVLAGVALAVVVALGIWLRRAESVLVAVALGAIAGGAVGNIIDRLRFGWVVDFIDCHIGAWHWPVFNVADSAIVCGVAALVLESLLPVPRKRERAG